MYKVANYSCRFDPYDRLDPYGPGPVREPVPLPGRETFRDPYARDSLRDPYRDMFRDPLREPVRDPFRDPYLPQPAYGM